MNGVDEGFYATRRRVLEPIATGAALPTILESIVRLAEVQADGMRCSILRFDEAGQTLAHGAAPTTSHGSSARPSTA
jgi:hypothetical protein